MPSRINNKRPRAQKGVILITVIMLIMVLSLVAIGILSLYVSQMKTTQSVVDTIKAEQLAMGEVYQQYQCHEWGLCTTSPATQNLDGKNYTVSAVAQSTDPNTNIRTYHINVSF